MSHEGNITIETDSFYPIKVELEDALPATFEVAFESDLVLDVNFGIPGPKGEKGDKGDKGDLSNLNDLLDVQITNATNGDTLIFDAGVFKNTPITFVTDGGNF